MSEISAFVITCDKKPEAVLHATLKRVSWADEVVLVDKGRRKVPYRWSDKSDPKYKYVQICWSPVHEADRNIGLANCVHPWIIAVDDDEILSPICEDVFRDFVERDEFDVLEVPIHHYVLGRFDKAAPHWPEWRPVLHRRGSLVYGSTLHHGIGIVNGSRVLKLHQDSSAFIQHLSHANISQWFEKTNRYTDYPDRSTNGRVETDYPSAVAWLRQAYDHIDALKRWEAANLPDGNAEFRRLAEEILRG